MVSALIEVGAGLPLVVWPSLPVSLLFGSGLDSPAAAAVGRVAGAALLALGVACWLTRNDEQTHAVFGVIAAMLLYNTAAVVILSCAALGLEQTSFGLWLAVVLHIGMAGWCIACVRIKAAQPTS